MSKGRRTPGGVTRLSITVPQVLYEEYEEQTGFESPSELVTHALMDAVTSRSHRPSRYLTISELLDALEGKMRAAEVQDFVYFSDKELSELSDEEAGHLAQKLLHLEPGEELWIEGDDDPV